jgi:SAM-dependent methyltransferase
VSNESAGPTPVFGATVEQPKAAIARVLLNLGCGPRDIARVPAHFDSWRQLRVDIEAEVEPDLIADATDLSAIADGTIDAVWSAHCIEHLYQHEVTKALSEIYRVLRDDGIACIVVPDLQTIASYMVADRLHEVVYQSPAGPITAHDILFGYGPAIARGHTHMAHRCGFTPTTMLHHLNEARFGQFVLRRRPPSLELAVVARKTPWPDASERDTLMQQLAL